jgi:hypothetical protein
LGSSPFVVVVVVYLGLIVSFDLVSRGGMRRLGRIKSPERYREGNAKVDKRGRRGGVHECSPSTKEIDGRILMTNPHNINL